MVEILDGRVCKVCNKQFITLGHCEIWSHFTRTLYFYSSSARDNTDATREISRHISRQTRVISLILLYRCDRLWENRTFGGEMKI